MTDVMLPVVSAEDAVVIKQDTAPSNEAKGSPTTLFSEVFKERIENPSDSSSNLTLDNTDGEVPKSTFLAEDGKLSPPLTLISKHLPEVELSDLNVRAESATAQAIVAEEHEAAPVQVNDEVRESPVPVLDSPMVLGAEQDPGSELSSLPLASSTLPTEEHASPPTERESPADTDGAALDQEPLLPAQAPAFSALPREIGDADATKIAQNLGPIPAMVKGKSEVRQQSDPAIAAVEATSEEIPLSGETRVNPRSLDTEVPWPTRTAAVQSADAFRSDQVQARALTALSQANEAPSSSHASPPANVLNYEPAGIASAQRTSPQMDLPMGAKGWNDELGNRILWLFTQRVNVAELRLNPPHLGPMEIRIALDKDTTNINFTVHSLGIREAVEAALPRLRELFNDAGVSLQDVNVSERQADGRHAQQDPSPSRAAGQPAGEGSPDNSESGTSMSSRQTGSTQALLDTYV